jgi:hypothetical protein
MIALSRISTKKFVIVGCVVLALAFLALVICLDAYFRENRPSEPQPIEGRVYATRLSKGVWVYLTRIEQIVYQLLMPLGVVSIVIGVMLNVWWKQFPHRNKSQSLENNKLLITLRSVTHSKFLLASAKANAVQQRLCRLQERLQVREARAFLLDRSVFIRPR